MTRPGQMARTPLLPSGTARAAFGIAAPAGPPGAAPDEAFPATLAAELAGRDVPDADLVAGWEVARWAAPAPVPIRRALACLVVGLLEAEAEGGTLLPLRHQARPAGGMAAPLPRRLARLGLAAPLIADVEALAAALVDGTAPGPVAALVGRPEGPGPRRPFVLTANGALQSDRLWALEGELGALLRARLDGNATPLAPPAAIDAALAAAESSPGAPPISPEQRAAVRAALTRPLTLVAGGPGTGKTSIVVALLRALVRLDVPAERIALAAPTGRAAQRMKESVDAALARLTAPDPADAALAAATPAAATLHRLIGVRPSRERVLEADSPLFHAGWRLPHRIVVVDEASMIDLGLMRLLAAAVADDAHLVLLGDPDQLPSVDAGAVFRDLLAGAPEAAFRLTRSHRMNPERPEGAAILRVANQVKDAAVSSGDSPLTLADARRAAAAREAAIDIRFAGVEALPAAELGAFLDRWHREILGADTHLGEALDRRLRVDAGGAPNGTDSEQVVAALLAVHAAARILCITRTAGRRSSAQAVNQALHARVQTAALGRGVSPALATAAFVPGEPVILLANDYGRGLFNGDVGVVVRVHGGTRGEHLGVAFSRGPASVVHRLDELAAHLAPAFALTVHKAQGSEYERVALILPETDVPLLSREIVYTALTRARSSVTLVGDEALFTLAAGRPLDRLSNLAEQLALSRPRGDAAP